MLWYGGYLTRPDGQRRPVGAQMLWDTPALWSAGVPVRIAAGSNGRRLAVFGPCTASNTQLDQLLRRHDLAAWDAAVTAWAGAYTLVLDDAGGSVFVWADPAGACPLYVARSGGEAVWGSSSLALAALIGARPDTAWLAGHLVDPTAFTPGRSAWTGVEQIPPGHRFTVRSGDSVTTVPFWHPSQLAWPDAVHRLREDLAGSVRARAGSGPVSSDLSGGLDSSTLAVLAARLGPVLGVTYHPKGVTSGGDLDHARAVARASPSIRHELMPMCREHLPFTDLSRLPLTDEPAPSAITVAQLSAQLNFLVGLGATTHLTGDGGDSLFMPPPVHLADLARSGRLFRLASDAQSWARLYRASPWPVVSSAWREPRRLVGRSKAAPWLTTNANELALSVTAPYPDMQLLGHADDFVLTEARYVGRTAATEGQLASVHGITMHNPFTDPRVVEAVLSVDASRRWSARRYKPLLSDVAAPLLPAQVLDRGAKGLFAVDHHHGLRANKSQVLDLVDGHLAEHGLIRPAAVRALLSHALLGVDIPWGRIEPVLGAELWLRAAEVTPSTVRWEVGAA
ncbi:asparagine synthase (glutamine-hydrolyzing) [Kitasatospora sp. MAA4]|uniref:albusnodin/ikarugamycin family macrolactam cyclase n=1 Tax=Kitasatospora sp. MAA4 TaxID=3035093 RepID=UPI0024744776|nr:albusnodin/ikarugamycin family macrolactam cyclase [Kitasatospora sp. MAA4]MDH6132845.1 asparagine synthase (glutamine-hydrolyzing) [Kitasatospora sp. MAA4]